MKTTKSVRSLASFKSTKSLRSNMESKKGDPGGEILDLANMLPAACTKLQCPFVIAVQKRQQQDEYYKSVKYGDTTPRTRKKLSIMPQGPNDVSQPSVVKTPEENKSLDTDHTPDANTLTVQAIYDIHNCLTQIALHKMKVPRMLLQIMGLLVPYFQSLTTLTIQQCQIENLHEIRKLLELSTITSIDIDRSPVLQRSYEILLNEQSNLRNLSLCRCKLDDDDCELLAAKLHHRAPAENLQTLNLSSNHITNVGIKYISDALRSNRRLRYLNLADNRIDDEGAGYLLDVLTEFPLTHDEISKTRIRYMKYLRYKQSLCEKYLNECDKSYDDLSQISRKSKRSRKEKSPRKDKDSRKTSDEDVRERAEMLAKEILGEFIDPFESNSIKYRDNYQYSLGNLALSYLNISYNNISYLTVKKLLNVVMYQSVTKKPNQSGLIKVLIDGNNVPMCKEMTLLNDLLGKYIRQFAGKAELLKRRRSRVY